MALVHARKTQKCLQHLALTIHETRAHSNHYMVNQIPKSIFCFIVISINSNLIISDYLYLSRWGLMSKTLTLSMSFRMT